MLKEQEHFEREERARRLVEARKAAGLRGPKAVADALGWNESGLNKYKAHESGRNGFGISDAKIYADLFSVDVGWLMTGKGSPDPQENPIRLVPLKGYIGAGGHVEAIDNGNDDEVEAPVDSHPATVAAQIRGDSQLPVLQDGWIIYWSTQLPASSLLNQMAVVQLADGRIMVKTIRNGSQPGFFTLTSYNAADIVDVPVDWAAKIDWIKPR